MNKFMSGILMLIVSVIAFNLISCKKDDNPTCVAGSGGNVQIVVFAIHNGDTLINSQQHPDTAFVKYGTTTSPGTNPSDFDAYYVSEEAEDHIHLTNLHCGGYYIYRTAYDTVSNMRYAGGTGIAVSKTSGEVVTAITVN